MSWKNLKTFAIAILVAMNAFFLYSLIERTHAVQYYDDKLIDSATEIFRESNLYVDRSFLTARQVSLPVYTGTVSDVFFDDLSKKMESAGYIAEYGPGGMHFIGANDEYYIGNDFAFLYFTEEDSPKPSELLLNGAFIKRENPDFSEVEKIIQTFLSALSIPEQEKKFAYELDFTDFYTSGTESVVCVMQKINGKDTENRLYLLLSEGHVIAADGFFALTSPQRRLSTQTVGMMEILFSEKNYLDERYRESGEISRENMILSSVKISYAVYFDADGSFYFVPVRTLVYQNGESRTYNDVSGEIYS